MRRLTQLASARCWVWLLGIALALGYYTVQAHHRAQATPVGVERRLFGLWDVRTRLLSSPDGEHWIVSTSPDDSAIGTGGLRMPWTEQARQLLSGWRIPVGSVSLRSLSMLPRSGTWALNDTALPRLWDMTANFWPEDGYLLGRGPQPYSSRWWRLNLKTGRDRELGYYDAEIWRLEYPDDGAYTDSHEALGSALEAPFGGRQRRWEVERYRIGEQTVTLAYHSQPPLAAPVLLAISNDDAPRVLRLTSGGKPLALSRDGRTLFFRRENALWRLDLRKPLPELLQAVEFPELELPELTSE